MNDEQRFDRTTRTWLEDGPTRAPEPPVAAALAEIATKSQERDLRVPWRLPDMPMLLRVATAAIVIVLIGGGAMLLLQGTGLPGVAAPPTSAPSPVATPMSVGAYTTAYNAICDEADADTDPLRPRFVGVFDGSISEGQRAGWAGALQQFHDRTLAAADELGALSPPPELADGHYRNVQALRDELDFVQDIAQGLRDHRDSEALAADTATVPLGHQIFDWENEHALHHCP